ncbi:MAG: serine protease, partial [Planctomycetota bacterium]
AGGGEAPPAHLEDRTLADVVYVTAGESAGTAFLLRYGDARYLVTARHVVAEHLDDPTVPVSFHVGGRRGRPIRSVALLRESSRADIAVFTFDDDPEAPYFPEGAGLVPTADLHLASQVFLVGYPASLRQTYGSSQLRVVGGWIAGVKKYVPGSTVEYVDIDMPGVEHGHSGGPILLLQDRVVAVAVQRRTGGVSGAIAATYAVPIKYVTALIDDQPVSEDVQALNETLRGTTFLCGLSLQGKTDFDVWAQRIHRDTGEAVWGETGILVASSQSPESEFHTVGSLAESTLVIHTLESPDGRDGDVMVQRVSRYGELLFNAGVRSLPVASTRFDERAPAAASDGTGGAIVAYELLLPDGDIDVMAQRLDAEGARLWDVEGVALASAKVPEFGPKMVADGAGGAIVVLTRRLRDGDTDIVTQRIGREGDPTWNGGRRSVEISASERAEANPSVVSDGRGGALVVFEIQNEAGERLLAAQRLSHHGERQWNEGKPIRVSGLPLAGEPGSVAVAPDGLGGAFVAFEVVADPAKPDDVDIAVQRIGGEGVLAWGQEGAKGGRLPVLAASSPFAEKRPSIRSDGQGGIVVVFDSGSENGDLDVWAQRVDGQGKLVWNEGRRSVEVSLTFLNEHRPRIVGRFQDRIMVVFEVEREGGGSTVACQALSLERGAAVYGGGKTPILVLQPGDTSTNFFLGPR